MRTIPKEDAQGRGAEGVQNKAHGQYATYSTVTETRHACILDMLTASPRNTEELHAAGIFQVPTRILEQRRKRWPIATAQIARDDCNEFTYSGVALTTLEDGQ